MTKFGLLLPSREAIVWGGVDRLVGIARAAEAAGFDSVWAGDSIVARPRLDPLALLSAAAGATSRVEVGTAIYLPLLRDAVVAAHLLASLDQVSGGRLTVGVGPGASIPATDDELRTVGQSMGHRVSRLVEVVGAWRAHWASADVRPVSRSAGVSSSSVPVWLAGAGPRMLRLAGESFDGWLPYSPTVDQYSTGLRAVRAAAGDRGGVVAALYATVTIEHDAAAARAELDAFLTGYYWLGLDVMGQVQACAAGPLDEVVAWIRSYVAAGAQHVVLRLGHRRLDAHAGLASALREALEG